MCCQMYISLKNIREFQKDFLKEKHLGVSKNLCWSYRQLIVDSVFNWLREPRRSQKYNSKIEYFDSRDLVLKYL